MSHRTIHALQKKEAPQLEVRGLALAYLAATRGKRTPASQSLTRHRLLVFADYCAAHHIGVEQCDARVVASFVEHLEETHPAKKRGATVISRATTAGFVQCVRAMLTWAAFDELCYSSYVDEKAIKRIARPKQDEDIVETLDDSHVRALLTAARLEENAYMQARARTIIAVLYGSGIRASELCNLRVQHCVLDADAAYLMIHLAKGRKSRRVPLAEPTRRKLEDWILTWRAEQPATTIVFPGRDKSSQLTTGGLQQLIRRLAERAGITDRRVAPHDFRHAYSARFIKNGGDIYTLQRLLGHSSVTTTQIYLKSISGAGFDLADRALPYLR